VDAVAKGMANPLFGADLAASRRRVGVRLVELSEAPREALRSLRRGHVLGLIADQNAREQGVFVPFLGRDAATFRGPALFALRTGAPIFLGIPLREPGVPARYRVTVERITAPATGDLEEDVRVLTAAHTAALERAVRQAPEQYFWQHRRWKTQPPGGP
jgi:KDO2-lipid IV(A) lauroyltransferase